MASYATALAREKMYIEMGHFSLWGGGPTQTSSDFYEFVSLPLVSLHGKQILFKIDRPVLGCNI